MPEAFFTDRATVMAVPDAIAGTWKVTLPSASACAVTEKDVPADDSIGGELKFRGRLKNDDVCETKEDKKHAEQTWTQPTTRRQAQSGSAESQQAYSHNSRKPVPPGTPRDCGAVC